jgi:hypothetical protein
MPMNQERDSSVSIVGLSTSANGGALHLSAGAALHRGLLFLAAVSDLDGLQRNPPSTIFRLTPERGDEFRLPWSVCSVTPCQAPSTQAIAISPSGFVCALDEDGLHEESMIGADTPHQRPADRGELREVRGIAGGHAYAVGAGGQVYRRDCVGEWVCIDQAARIGTAMRETNFESIDGFSESDLYAVGSGGEIWHYDTNAWRQLPSPTERTLHSVRCAPDGWVYACGDKGTVVRGRGDQWTLAAESPTDDDLWKLEYFADTVWVASPCTLYTIRGSALTEVAFGPTPPASIVQLSVADGLLWSFGAREIHCFDLTEWSVLTPVERKFSPNCDTGPLHDHLRLAVGSNTLSFWQFTNPREGSR